MTWRETLSRAQGVPVPLPGLEAALQEVWSGVAVTDITLLEGGLGSVLHRVHLRGAAVDTVVLRQLLHEFGQDAATARREVVVHAALPDHGVPVPHVHWSDPDGAVLGRPALVLDDVAGHLLLADLATPAARRAFATVIHQVHDVPTTALHTLPVLDDVTAHADFFGAPGAGADLVDATRIAGAIRAAQRWFRPQARLLHNDLHAGNVLWDGRVVTGVLDWPGAALGVPGCDEAYAWVDTALAHGRDVADALQAEVDDRRTGARPSQGEVTLWRACALRRALPSPAPWAETYRAAGLDVTDEQVETRFVALVDDELGRD